MAWVTQISEEQAGPQLKPLYEQIRSAMGFVPNFYQAIGRNPELVRAKLALGNAILADGALSRASKEQIGLVVSGLNTSSYCIAVHMEMLRGLGVEKSLGRTLAVDYAHAPVEPKVQALFQFADKLTRKPADVEQADVEALRAAGWSEDAIVEATLAVAYFNLVNCVSTGLGLVADF